MYFLHFCSKMSKNDIFSHFYDIFWVFKPGPVGPRVGPHQGDEPRGTRKTTFFRGFFGFFKPLLKVILQKPEKWLFANCHLASGLKRLFFWDLKKRSHPNLAFFSKNAARLRCVFLKNTKKSFFDVF